MKKINGLSLFSGGGIGEMNLGNSPVKIVVANEILETRSDFYKFYNPHVKMFNIDIRGNNSKKMIIDECRKKKVDFIMATPPCQGASLLGKNKNTEEMRKDFRNYLIFDALEIIDSIKPSFVLFENVVRFYTMKYDFGNHKGITLLEILKLKYGKEYNIDYDVFNSADYGVPQTRKRGIVRMFKFGKRWNNPTKTKQITVREAIGKLPSLESGEKSDIKNHYARVHTKEHILCMKHTATGHSALENDVYYPKDETGNKSHGFSATYKRIEWDKPAPTITMRNDCISSQSNVHPGRLLKDGTYSDARVLTLREIFILSSINPDLEIPSNVSDIQVRYIVGEGVPPKLMSSIIGGIVNE